MYKRQYILRAYFSHSNCKKCIYDCKGKSLYYPPVIDTSKDVYKGQVRQNYVGEIDEKTLMDSISEGYIGGIQDRYAAYYSVESTNTRDLISSGKLIGIGANVNADASGYLRVTSVYSDSPASVAGLQKDDLILKIGDQDIRSMDFTKSRELLYGEAGTSVILTIRRDNTDSQLEIVRKNYTVPVLSLIHI